MCCVEKKRREHNHVLWGFFIVLFAKIKRVSYLIFYETYIANYASVRRNVGFLAIAKFIFEARVCYNTKIIQ